MATFPKGQAAPQSGLSSRSPAHGFALCTPGPFSNLASLPRDLVTVALGTMLFVTMVDLLALHQLLLDSFGFVQR